MDPNDEPEEDGANIDLDAHRKGKCAVIKTSTRQVMTDQLNIHFYACINIIMNNSVNVNVIFFILF